MHAKVRYDPSCYDRYLCLKPPLMLWVVVLYLSRAIVVSFLAQISNASGGGDTVGGLRGLFTASALLPSFLACLVLAALLLRSPASGSLARWFFARGRLILACAAVLDLGLGLPESLWRHGELGEVGLGGLLGAAFDVYLLVYLLASRRTRDVFAAYPAAEPPAGK